MPPPTLEDLRRYAVARSLFKPTTLPVALRRLGFVQADPIRAPARAQDLTLRHRVEGYRGLLHVTRRENGIRIYAAHEHAPLVGDVATRRERLDRLVDVIVGIYAPLPAPSLSALVGRLRYGTPQWHPELKAAIQRAKDRLVHARNDGVSWYWPAGERPASSRHAPKDEVRPLAPFDPIVWDRRRFELLWGWGYRFEAYTPAPRRKLGYYALPFLWRDEVIGWGNLTVKDGRIVGDFGYVAGRAPRERVFGDAFRAELDRMRTFLGLQD